MHFTQGRWRKPHEFITRNMNIMDKEYKKELGTRIKQLFEIEKLLMSLRTDITAEATDFAVKLLEDKRIEYENELKGPEDKL